MNSSLFADDGQNCAPAFSFKVPPTSAVLSLGQQDSIPSGVLTIDRLDHWKAFNESSKFDCCNLTGFDDTFAAGSFCPASSTCSGRFEFSEPLDHPFNLKPDLMGSEQAFVSELPQPAALGQERLGMALDEMCALPRRELFEKS